MLLTAGRTLLRDALPMIEERGITLIGVTFSNLSNDDAIQLALPFGKVPAAAMDTTLDNVRERFGSKSLTRGVLLGRRDGLQVPLLPD
jgi:DNA polymerase-4